MSAAPVPSELPPLRLRSARTALVRSALAAPELERYLSRHRIDLLVTDPIEALQVRVREGVAVLERRVERARRAARRRLTGLLALLLAHALLVAFLLREATNPGGSLSGPALFLLLLASAALPVSAGAILRLARDLAQLRALEGRYSGRAERITSRDELLAFAGRVLDEARALGVLGAPAER